jgi:hypothetical protein
MPDDPNTPQNGGGEQPKTSPAEKRINQLYGRAKAAEERVDTLVQRLDDLETQNQELRQEVLLTRKTETAVPPAPTGVTDPSLSDASDIRGVVRGEIKDVLQEFQNQSKAERYQEALVRSHEQSLRQAAAEEPALLDANSEVWKQVDHVFSNDRGLQADPHGPLKALYLVRGMGLAQSQGVDIDRKAAASVPTGAGDIADGGKQREIDEVKAEYEAMVQKQRRGQGDPMQLHRQARNLKLKLARLQGQDIGPLVSKPGSG